MTDLYTANKEHEKQRHLRKIELFLEVLGGLEKGRWGSKAARSCLLGAGVLGYSLGSLRDGVFGQLSGQDQTDGCLDFPAGNGGTLVVVGKTGSFTGNTLEDIVDERIHDAHSLAGDTSVGVDLLQDLVDVDGITLSRLFFLLPPFPAGLAGLAAFLEPFELTLGGMIGISDQVN